MAIEDAFILARAIAAEPNMATALQQYEQARHGRTTRMVQGAAANTQRFHNPELADADGARAYLACEWNEARVMERYEWLYNYDVTTAAI